MTAPSKEADDGLRGIAWGMACISLPLFGLGVMKTYSAASVLSMDEKPRSSEVGQSIDRDLDAAWIFLGSGAIGLLGAAAFSKISRRLPRHEQV